MHQPKRVFVVPASYICNLISVIAMSNIQFPLAWIPRWDLIAGKDLPWRMSVGEARIPVHR